MYNIHTHTNLELTKRAYRKRERNKHEAHSAIKQIIPVDQRNLNLGFLLPPGSMGLYGIMLGFWLAWIWGIARFSLIQRFEIFELFSIWGKVWDERWVVYAQVVTFGSTWVLMEVWYVVRGILDVVISQIRSNQISSDQLRTKPWKEVHRLVLN